LGQLKLRGTNEKGGSFTRDPPVPRKKEKIGGEKRKKGGGPMVREECPKGLLCSPRLGSKNERRSSHL